MGTYIIGYDIANPRRLCRIHRMMKKHGLPIQYSIFMLEGNEVAVQRCLDAVLPLMNPKEDDIRCYLLPQRGQQFRIGKPVLPEGIIWTGLPATII